MAGVETIYGLVGLSLAFFVALEENAEKNARKERLITSGADIIIGNVLPFLKLSQE